MKKNPAQQYKSSSKKTGIQQLLIHLCTCSAVVTLLLLSILNIETLKHKQKVLGESTEIIKENLIKNSNEDYWISILSQNPDYIDGWVELTKIYIDRGDSYRAIQTYWKAKQLNPNSPEVKILELTLNN